MGFRPIRALEMLMPRYRLPGTARRGMVERLGDYLSKLVLLAANVRAMVWWKARRLWAGS